MIDQNESPLGNELKKYYMNISSNENKEKKYYKKILSNDNKEKKYYMNIASNLNEESKRKYFQILCSNSPLEWERTDSLRKIVNIVDHSKD